MKTGDERLLVIVMSLIKRCTVTHVSDNTQDFNVYLFELFFYRVDIIAH